MLRFSISYWDLIKFHYFEDTTKEGMGCERDGDFTDNFNACKKNDGMSWQGAWESTMKHDNVLNLSLSWCEILRELERKTWFIYLEYSSSIAKWATRTEVRFKTVHMEKNRGPSYFSNLNQLSFICQRGIMHNFHAAHILHSMLG